MTKAEIINASLSSKSQTNPSKSPQLESKEQDIENCFTQSQDTMIFNYLMGEAAKKGWKEGCRLRVKNGKEYEEYTATEFRLRKENNEYKVATMVDNSVFYLLLDECTLIPEKLTFNGFDVRMWDQNNGFVINYINRDLYLHKEDALVLLPTLLPKNKAEVEAILKAMEE